MRCPRSVKAPAGLALGLIMLAAGCGSETRTVTIASSPPSTTATATTTTQSVPTASTPAQTATTAAPAPAVTTTTPAPATTTTTRKAPEPEFTEHQSKAPEGAPAAAAVLRSQGFSPRSLAEYHPSQALRVLVGIRTGSADDHGQEAFFFLDGRYLGTDSKEPSASIEVVSQADTEVAIAYRLYRPSGAPAAPGAGTRVVRFQLDNGQLTVIGRIPPASSASGLSRN